MKLETLSMRAQVRFRLILILIIGVCVAECGSNLRSQDPMPAEDQTEKTNMPGRVGRAATWLAKHVLVGTYQASDDETSRVSSRQLSLIAWLDPTLNDGRGEVLAGYLTTDNLWAAHALVTLRPKVAESLQHSLTALSGLENGLHEVLFGRIPVICHRPLDPDFVHGRRIGTIHVPDGQVIDVRRFTMGTDDAFTEGHPRLFAEHAGYQALFEFWRGDVDKSRLRMIEILSGTPNHSEQRPVFWDQKHQLLVDHGNYKDWKDLSAANVCSQYPIKLGVIAYAAKQIGLEKDFPNELASLQARLWQCQLPSGGLSHSMRIDFKTGQLSLSGPTAEATAIAILCQTMQP